MLRKPVTVDVDSDLFSAIHQILVHKISGVIVIDETRRPVGMLSELDALRAILTGSYHQEEVGMIPVADFMTSPVETIKADEDIIDVAASMLDHKHRRRPVVDSHGVLVGQMTCRRILKGIKDFDVGSDNKEG